MSAPGKLVRSSRCKSDPGKAVAGRLEISLAMPAMLEHDRNPL